MLQIKIYPEIFITSIIQFMNILKMISGYLEIELWKPKIIQDILNFKKEILKSNYGGPEIFKSSIYKYKNFN